MRHLFDPPAPQPHGPLAIALAALVAATVAGMWFGMADEIDLERTGDAAAAEELDQTAQLVDEARAPQPRFRSFAPGLRGLQSPRALDELARRARITAGRSGSSSPPRAAIVRGVRAPHATGAVINFPAVHIRARRRAGGWSRGARYHHYRLYQQYRRRLNHDRVDARRWRAQRAQPAHGLSAAGALPPAVLGSLRQSSGATSGSSILAQLLRSQAQAARRLGATAIASSTSHTYGVLTAGTDHGGAGDDGDPSLVSAADASAADADDVNEALVGDLGGQLLALVAGRRPFLARTTTLTSRSWPRRTERSRLLWVGVAGRHPLSCLAALIAELQPQEEPSSDKDADGDDAFGGDSALAV